MTFTWRGKENKMILKSKSTETWVFSGGIIVIGVVNSSGMEASSTVQWRRDATKGDIGNTP